MSKEQQKTAKGETNIPHKQMNEKGYVQKKNKETGNRLAKGYVQKKQGDWKPSGSFLES